MENKIQGEYHWWLWNTYPLTRHKCYHIPNGGSRGGVTAAQIINAAKTYKVIGALVSFLAGMANRNAMLEGSGLKSIGLIAGMPDYHHAIPANGYGSLYIEFKDEGKIIPIAKSDHEKNQKRIQDELREAGNCVVICDSVEQAKRELLYYLRGTKYLTRPVMPIIPIKK